jgi:hypothetical protein
MHLNEFNLVAFNWPNSYSSIYTVPYTWFKWICCLYLVAFTWLHSLGRIHLVAFTWMHSLGCIHLVAFTWLHSLGYIHVVAFTWLYSLTSIHFAGIHAILLFWKISGHPKFMYSQNVVKSLSHSAWHIFYQKKDKLYLACTLLYFKIGLTIFRYLYSTGTSMYFTNELPFSKVVNLEKKLVDLWCSGGVLHCSDHF